jgi:hypothetical protein
MPAADLLIARLQADCTAAEAAERADVETRVKHAETARAFAWRRLNMLSDMARIAAAESERDIAVERELVALFREIGWIERGLDELGESPQLMVDRLRPLGDALFAQVLRRRQATIGVAFFVGLCHAGGPLPDAAARTKLKEVEADVQATRWRLTAACFFDREGRHLRVDEVA